jgi:hypothetical protein
LMISCYTSLLMFAQSISTVVPKFRNSIINRTSML